MAAHLNYDGLKKVLADIERFGKKKEVGHGKTKSEWKRLASFMRGRK